MYRSFFKMCFCLFAYIQKALWVILDNWTLLNRIWRMVPYGAHTFLLLLSQNISSQPGYKYYCFYRSRFTDSIPAFISLFRFNNLLLRTLFFVLFYPCWQNYWLKISQICLYWSLTSYEGKDIFTVHSCIFAHMQTKKAFIFFSIEPLNRSQGLIPSPSN